MNNELIKASNDECYDVIINLIKNGADVHTCDDYAFRRAAENGNLEVVKFLVEKGANINADNCYALRWAIVNGHLEVVKYLIENGANIHAKDVYALRRASEIGNLEIVKFIVNNGTNICAYFNDALYYSSMNGHIEVVKFLVENEGDIFSKNGDNDLRMISNNGYLASIKHLIDNIDKQKYICSHYNYCFINAAENGHIEVVKFLAENKANIHSYSDKALRSAAKNGHLEVVKFLVENGADIHVNSDEALHLSSTFTHEDVVKYLIENKANINVLSNCLRRRYGLPTMILSKKSDNLFLFNNSSKCSLSNLNLTSKSVKVGCAKCLSVFEKSELEKWFEVNNTSCPKCKDGIEFYLV